MDLVLLFSALLGHAFLWVALVNRIHAKAVEPWFGHFLSLTCLGCLLLIPIAFALWILPPGFDLTRFRWSGVPTAAIPYLAACWISSITAIGWWFWHGVLHRPPPLLRLHRTRTVRLTPESTPASEEHAHHYLVRLPGNQILHLDMTERAIDVPRLVPALDGLSIVHLSDFHFTGRVGKAYFQDVVRRTNEIRPDLIVLTGDLVDDSNCIDWVPDTLGQLQARFGVYFVLGNHDLRVDIERLRQVLHDCGLVDLGGRWLEVDVRGEPIILAGNELPWLPPAADMTRCPIGPLRIILSHSPDQLDWARRQDADLLLAGHTHGGQIRLPLIGAIFAPSRRGVKYASGLFHSRPTIMHVTRGVSGELPVRLNCPPEMAHLVLHSMPDEPL